VGITSGMSGVLEKVQAYLAYWEKKYKHIWEQDKEAYIRRWGSGRGTGTVYTPPSSIGLQAVNSSILGGGAGGEVSALFVVKERCPWLRSAGRNFGANHC
jgi:hypothetical protein